MSFAEKIRALKDYPIEGVVFRDITTLLKDPVAFPEAMDAMVECAESFSPDLIVGVEARGFIVGAPVAYRLKKGFVPVRKPGKLPWEKIEAEYSLEYGTDKVQIHKDAIAPGQKVLIVDDLLATGGTSKAVIRLVEELGGEVAGLLYLIELEDLPGREFLKGYPVKSILQYTDGE